MELIQTTYSGNELELISELVNGSKRAFGEFFFAHKDRVYAIAFALAISSGRK